MFDDFFDLLSNYRNNAFGPSSDASGAAAAVTNPQAAVAGPTLAGVNQQDLQNASFNTMGQIGMLLAAAGQGGQSRAQRAGTLAAIAPTLGGFDRHVLNSAQARLIEQKSQEANAAAVRQQEAIKTALADPATPQAIKNLIQADPDAGLKYLAQVNTPVPKQDNWSISNTDNGPVRINSTTGETQPLAGTAPAAGAPEGLSGPALKKYNEKLGEERAKRLSELSSTGETAQNLLPTLQSARDVYQQLAQRNAIGPIQGSAPGRFVERLLPVSGVQKDEALRERFDQLKKQLELFKAQTEMAKQGQITESERKLLSMATGGALDAVDPQVGLQALDQALSQSQRSIRDAANAREGKLPDLNPAPADRGVFNRNQQNAQPDMSQARQAPDGHTYVPDPARPGKYLRVN